MYEFLIVNVSNLICYKILHTDIFQRSISLTGKIYGNFIKIFRLSHGKYIVSRQIIRERDRTEFCAIYYALSSLDEPGDPFARPSEQRDAGRKIYGD